MEAKDFLKLLEAAINATEKANSTATVALALSAISIAVSIACLFLK